MSKEVTNEKIMEAFEELKGMVLTPEVLEGKVKSIKEDVIKELKGEAIDSEIESKFADLMKEIADVKEMNSRTEKEDGVSPELKKHIEIQERYYKSGKEGLTPDEFKLMTSNDDTTGGYLAGDQTDKMILKDITEMNAMMQVATIKNTKSKTYTFLKVVKISAAETAGEGEAGENKDVKFERIEISTFPYKHSVYTTLEDIEDAEKGDLVKIINTELSEGITEGVENDFITGNDVNKAQGFLTDDDIEVVETESASAFLDTDIVNLFYKLKKGYKKNASWFANSQVLSYIAQMKTGDGKFQFSLEPLKGYPGSIATLMNRPVYETPAMTDDPTTAGGKILAVGDWKKGYCVVNRTGTTVRRDDMTQMAEDVVRFFGRKRIGGHVILPEAIKILKVKA